MKQLNSNKTRFLRFDKFLVIQAIAEVYGESKERQLCSEINKTSLIFEEHDLLKTVRCTVFLRMGTQSVLEDQI